MLEQIIGSLIGGLFSVLCLIITLKHEKRIEANKIKLANKPLFYRLDPLQEYDTKKAIDFIIGDNRTENSKEIIGVIKNTDNANFIIEEVKINGQSLKPLYGNLIDKNQIFNLYIFANNELDINGDVVLYVKDVMNNEYEYKLVLKDCNSRVEIIGIEEI